MENDEIAQIIRRESRFICFLIVLTNVFVGYIFTQLRTVTDTNTGVFLNTFLISALIAITLIKKPLEVVDLRPTKNIDLT